MDAPTTSTRPNLAIPLEITAPKLLYVLAAVSPTLLLASANVGVFPSKLSNAACEAVEMSEELIAPAIPAMDGPLVDIDGAT